MKRVNFDHLARPYRYLEYLTFGPILQRTRTHYLNQLTHHRQALILGDGDGRFTAQLLKSNPQIQIHAVDISARMLQSLRNSAHPHQTRLTTEPADLRTWTPAPHAKYDLIVTHFLLDCLTTQEITDLAQRLHPSVAPNAHWLVSEFAIPPTTFGQLIASPIVALLYHSFRLLTHLPIRHLPNYLQALQSTGWTLQSHHPRLKGLLRSEVWSAHSGNTPETTNNPADSPTR